MAAWALGFGEIPEHLRGGAIGALLELMSDTTQPSAVRAQAAEAAAGKLEHSETNKPLRVAPRHSWSKCSMILSPRFAFGARSAGEGGCGAVAVGDELEAGAQVVDDGAGAGADQAFQGADERFPPLGADGQELSDGVQVGADLPAALDDEAADLVGLVAGANEEAGAGEDQGVDGGASSSGDRPSPAPARHR
jgi:hypothetical protein